MHTKRILKNSISKIFFWLSPPVRTANLKMGRKFPKFPILTGELSQKNIFEIEFFKKLFIKATLIHSLTRLCNMKSRIGRESLQMLYQRARSFGSICPILLDFGSSFVELDHMQAVENDCICSD